jgi:hypothetical protein
MIATIMPAAANARLTLVVPQFNFAAAAELSALQRLAAYAGLQRRATAGPATHEPWQCELLDALRLHVSLYPSAPFTWLGTGLEGSDAERGTWLHADPVRMETSTDGLALQLCEWPDDIGNVVPGLRTHLAEAGIEWHMAAGRAFIHSATEMAVTMPSARQATHAVREALPQGPHAVRLRRLLTELQMLMHDKFAHNQERISPNAVWLWGAGQVRSCSPQPLLPAWTNDGFTRGIYRAHGAQAQCASLPASAEAVLKCADTQLLVVARDLSPDDLEAGWFAPALRALNTGRLQQIELLLDGWQLTVRRSWRRWFVRPRSLAAWA